MFILFQYKFVLYIIYTLHDRVCGINIVNPGNKTSVNIPDNVFDMYNYNNSTFVTAVDRSDA